MRHIALIILAAFFLAGCSKSRRPVGMKATVDSAAVIVLVQLEEKETATYRLIEVIKNDGTYPLRQHPGERLKLNYLPDAVNGYRELIVIGREERGNDLMPFRDYWGFPLEGDLIPALDRSSLDQIRALVRSQK